MGYRPVSAKEAENLRFHSSYQSTESQGLIDPILNPTPR
jgi:hypothetical protein